MGITPVLITAPTANNLLRGEAKVYADYGLPTQILLGVLSGGTEVNVEREIVPVDFDGAYGNVLDSDGLPLVRYTKCIPRMILNMLYLKYFNRKIISKCESDGTWESKDWAGTGGTYAAETTYYNSGKQSSKMTADTTAYGIHEVFATAKDLTVFDNSETSTTSDYIGFAIYISTQDLTDLGTSDLRIAFHMDAELTETNYYYYDVEAGDLTANQWTAFKILKSAFTEAGTGSWAAVTGVSLKLNGAPDAEVICYIDSISLIQAQTKSSFLPINAGNMSYTDETTYRLIVPEIAITEDDYLDNLTLISEKKDGKMWKAVIRNAYNDGDLTSAFEEFKQVVPSSQFTGHYLRGKETTPPIEFYEYTA